MCLPKPPKIDMPTPVQAPAQQEAKDADLNAVRRRQQQGGQIAGGTLLTDAGTGSTVNRGTTSLLGQ